MIGLNKAMQLWAECGMECPHSRTAEVQGMNGMRPTKGRRHIRRKMVEFPGISVYAEELGVRREHLWMVLTGRRVSRSLTARYNALVGKPA